MPPKRQPRSVGEQYVVLRQWNCYLRNAQARRLLVGLQVLEACGPPHHHNARHQKVRDELEQLERSRENAIKAALPEELDRVISRCGLPANDARVSALRQGHGSSASPSLGQQTESSLLLSQTSAPRASLTSTRELVVHYGVGSMGIGPGEEALERADSLQSQDEARARTGAELWAHLRGTVEQIALLAESDEGRALRVAAGIEQPIRTWAERHTASEAAARERKCFVFPSGRLRVSWDMYLLALLV